MTFVVFSLPRSRSAWLSTFLGAPGQVVGHDIGVTCSTPAQFIDRLCNDMSGTCETGAAFAARLIKRLVPEVRFVTVRRPVQDVCGSLARFGIHGLEAELQQRDGQLDTIEQSYPDTLHIEFKDLTLPAVCAEVHQFCTGRSMDISWWEALDPLNIQVDMARQIALLRANAPQIAELKTRVVEVLAHG